MSRVRSEGSKTSATLLISVPSARFVMFASRCDHGRLDALRGELPAQGPGRTVQETVDRGGRTHELTRDLARPEAGDETQDHDIALIAGKARDRLAEGGVDDRHRTAVGDGDLPELVMAPARRPADVVERLVSRDGREPGRERGRRWLLGVRPRHQLHEHVVAHVLRVVRIADHAERDRIYEVSMARV